MSARRCIVFVDEKSAAPLTSYQVRHNMLQERKEKETSGSGGKKKIERAKAI